MRREEQVQELKDEFQIQTVFCSKDQEMFSTCMTEICAKEKPTVCLEAIGGEMVGQMLDFMGHGATCIIYGCLSGQKAGGISCVRFLSFNQRIEPFFLGTHMHSLTTEQNKALIGKAIPMYGNILATKIQAKVPLNKIADAIELYQKN